MTAQKTRLEEDFKKIEEWGYGKVDVYPIKNFDVNGMQAPAYVLPGAWSIEMLNAPESQMNFKVLAEHGLVAHIMSHVYKDLRSQNKWLARQAIKSVTAHNSKLGLNWDVKAGKYTVNESKMFATSNYPTFIAKFIKEATSAGTYAEWVKHLAEVIKRPTTEVVRQEGRVTSSTIIPTGDLAVKGLQDRVRGLEDQLEDAMMRAEMLQSQVPATSRINQCLDKAHSMTVKGVEKILNSPEDTYIKSMMDPFHPDAVGTRIPSLNPVDTWTHTQFDTVSINVGAYSNAGKLMMVFNPTALSVSPIVLLTDPLGELPSLDAPAPLVKDVRTYDPYKINSQLRTYGIWGMQTPNKKIWDFINIPVNPITTQLDTKATGRIRLVSAGLRIFKVSTALAESGIIRLGYRPTGGAPQTSIDRMMETGPQSRYNVKVFPAQAQQGATRAGFLAQINYKPHSEEDVSGFHYPSSLFADNRPMMNIKDQAYQDPEDLKWDPADPDAGAARLGRYAGPLSFFGKRDVDPSWDFLNDTFQNRQAADWSGARYAINGEDLGRSHTMIVTFEANQGVNYEVEVIRHFEISPSEESPLEVKQAYLSDNYSSPMDLIRRHTIGDLNYNPFAPAQFSTRTTVWQLDPILTEQIKLVRQAMSSHDGPASQRINGLFGDALKWLMRNLGFKAIDWAKEKAHEWADPKTKGIMMQTESDDDDNGDGFEEEKTPS